MSVTDFEKLFQRSLRHMEVSDRTIAHFFLKKWGNFGEL